MERKIEDILQGVYAEMRQEKPRRQLKLHTEPARRPMVRRMVIAATGIAAAVIAGIFVLTLPREAHSEDFICYVNGARIVDRQAAMEYTRMAFDIAGAGLERSAEAVSSKMGRVGQVLGAFGQEN